MEIIRTIAYCFCIFSAGAMIGEISGAYTIAEFGSHLLKVIGFLLTAMAVVIVGLANIVEGEEK